MQTCVCLVNFGATFYECIPLLIPVADIDSRPGPCLKRHNFQGTREFVFSVSFSKLLSKDILVSATYIAGVSFS